MPELSPRTGVALLIAGNVVLLIIFAVGGIGNDGGRPTDPPLGALGATASPRVAMPLVTTSRSPVTPDGESAPGSPSAAAPSQVPVATPPLTGGPVQIPSEALVARAWRDTAGTVRVHIVVSATNDTRDVLSLATTERTFRIVGDAGQTLHNGRFPYAFPFVVPPGATSYLITTVVLPVGVDETDLLIEPNIQADVTTETQPALEVTDLRLVASQSRLGVRGSVRNTLADDVSLGVVAVIGRDASGRVLGGWYDNVNVAAIAAGDVATFQTEYPGLPPEAAGRITDLSGVAFDAGTSLRF